MTTFIFTANISAVEINIIRSYLQIERIILEHVEAPSLFDLNIA